MGLIEFSYSKLFCWQKRESLEDKSRRPKSCPWSTPEYKVELIYNVLKEHKTHSNFGGRRISDYLKRHNKEEIACSTASKIKFRLLKERPELKDSVKKKPSVRYEFSKPMEAWSGDFFELKWRKKMLEVCGIQDENSRFKTKYLVGLKADTQLLEDTFLSAESKYGSPDIFKSDNGTPMRSESFQKILKDRGIEWINNPNCYPRFNGKKERAIRSLRELIDPEELESCENLEEVQMLLDETVYRYNWIIPHQGIEGLLPADKFFDRDGKYKTKGEVINYITHNGKSVRILKV